MESHEPHFGNMRLSMEVFFTAARKRDRQPAEDFPTAVSYRSREIAEDDVTSASFFTAQLQAVVFTMSLILLWRDNC